MCLIYPLEDNRKGLRVGSEWPQSHFCLSLFVFSSCRHPEAQANFSRQQMDWRISWRISWRKSWRNSYVDSFEKLTCRQIDRRSFTTQHASRHQSTANQSTEMSTRRQSISFATHYKDRHVVVSTIWLTCYLLNQKLCQQIVRHDRRVFVLTLMWPLVLLTYIAHQQMTSNWRFCCRQISSTKKVDLH